MIKIINVLSKIFDWLWNVNLALGFMAIVIVSINAFSTKKVITANYLGNFDIKVEQVGELLTKTNTQKIYIDNLIGSPSVLLDWKYNIILIYVYMVFILSIVLFYNFHFMKLFNALKHYINQGTPFGEGISNRFKTLAKGSIILFFIGLILSTCKVIFIDEIIVDHITLTPVFDNEILNLGWLALGFYLIAGIFKIGLDIKKEQDLTI